MDINVELLKALAEANGERVEVRENGGVRLHGASGNGGWTGYGPEDIEHAIDQLTWEALHRDAQQGKGR